MVSYSPVPNAPDREKHALLGSPANGLPGLGVYKYDNKVGTIFVTSGSGAIGYRVAMRLLDAGHKSIRVGIWRGDREIGSESLGQKCADELEARGAEVVDFDWARDDNFTYAVEGVKTVFCTVPNIRGWQDSFPAFIRACKKAHVERFVKISYLGANRRASPYQDVPFVKFHGTCDDILMASRGDSKITYTVLCAAHLMSTPLIHQGPFLHSEHKFYSASYGMGVNYVSPNDVADAAVVTILRRKDHKNKTYTLTGERPIKDKEVSQHLSDFFGTPIEHCPVGYHEFKDFMMNCGHPAWLVKDSAEMERIKASGIDEKNNAYTDDLTKLIGRVPETFADYLNNKDSMTAAWQWPNEEEVRTANVKEVV